MGRGRKGLVMVTLAVALSVLSYAAYYYSYADPVYLGFKVARPIIRYPNGTVVASPYPSIQYYSGGLAVLEYPNGTSLVFNISTPNGLMELYKVAPGFFKKLNHGVALIIPNVFRGWIKINGVSTTLDYFLSYMGAVNDSALNITYTLSPLTLSQLNRTDPTLIKSLIKYIPYSVTIIITEPTMTINASNSAATVVTDHVEWDLKNAFGFIVARADQYISYATDCSSTYWVDAWIDTGGLPTYTFHNQITVNGQGWSEWGSLQAQETFSPPASLVNVTESTSFHLNVSNVVNGQIVTGTTYWLLTPSVIYYETSGSFLLNSPSSGGSYTLCS